MTSTDKTCEDVHNDNSESECEDERKHSKDERKHSKDACCDPMDDDVVVGSSDVQQLLSMADVLKKELPALKHRVQLLERMQVVGFAMCLVAVFL